jgi:DNA-binding CsgD family transcriptional regulator
VDGPERATDTLQDRDPGVRSPNGETPLKWFWARPPQKLRKLKTALITLGVLRGSTRRTFTPAMLNPSISGMPVQVSGSGRWTWVEVLRLAALGQTNRDIAAMLVLSDKTVERHLGHIFAKLQVSSRTGATRVAVQAGIALAD